MTYPTTGRETIIMNVRLARLGCSASIAAAIALPVLAPHAAADVEYVSVDFGGVRGPAVGCPYRVIVVLTTPVADTAVTITVNGIPLAGSVEFYPDDNRVYATWTPTDYGWQAIEAVQTRPGQRESRADTTVFVRGNGVSTGSSCLAWPL
ncbi:hypothetical protein [Nocardia sp. NPDC050175]|uniref:hypothetical protein n=1 Tax=Nocardia sp. NPDC050175 TaxID=3364317 RepID=UPI003796D614